MVGLGALYRSHNMGIVGRLTKSREHPSQPSPFWDSMLNEALLQQDARWCISIYLLY